jgi:small subunit ribosomal protein S17
MAEKKKKDETIEEPVAEVAEPVAEVEAPEPEVEPEVAAEPVSDTEVSDTVEETPEHERREPGSENQVPEVEEPEVAAEPVEPETQEPGSENQVPEVEPEPEAEVAAEPEAPAKRQRSGRHVPRTERRSRTKVVREKPKKRKPITRTEKPESELGRHQERRGVVVSDKGDKTIIVKVDVIKSHPKYKKVIRSTVKFHAHDEANTAGVGDKVRIIETRPLSKLKRWRLAEIVEKAK